MRSFIRFCAIFVCLGMSGVTAIAADTIYFTEDFEAANTPTFECWYKAEGTQVTSTITDTRAFSGKRCACIDAPFIAYFQIPLPKPLKLDRKAPDGIGNRPLYLSARVFAERVIPNTDTLLGFNASIVPRHRPGSDGAPLHGGPQDSVAGRTNQWLLLVMDVNRVLREAEDRGDLNPDQIVLKAVSMQCYGGGKYYVDDIRLATTPPEGWTPPPPSRPVVDAASCFRRDPKLESMILHGAYGGMGSVIGDVQLHPWVMRDMKRHYLNFAGPSFDFRFNAPERQLKEFDLVLDQARQYDMPVIPMSYIGSRYNSEAATMTDDQLRAAMVKIVRRYKNNPCLLAWYLEEEPGADRVAGYLKEKRWVDEEDPNHNCLMIFNAREGMEAIGPAQSVVMRDLYPVGGPNPNPWTVPLQVRHHARFFRQPFVLTDQIFAGYCCWSTPSVGQWRLMAYGALAEGAKGFCHYAYSTTPTFAQKVEQPQVGTMVDPYGTPSPIYDEIARHLGPDLFSIGELLRTCRPAADMECGGSTPPSNARLDAPNLSRFTIKCGTVEDALEHELPAIAVTRLVDTENRYEVIGIYNNNPDQSESGVLRLSPPWLGGRVVLDLSAHSAQIAREKPILLDGRSISVKLAPGDGRFIAVLPSNQVRAALDRMQTTRFDAVRQMVAFDILWLKRIGRDNPWWSRRLVALQTLRDERRPAEAVGRLLALDQAIQHSIHSDKRLSRVLTQLDRSRRSLSRAEEAIGTWARYKTGHPFPPDIEPAKSWCDEQQQLAELYVGFSDLAYSHNPPDDLVEPSADLARLCELHAAALQKTSARGAPGQGSTLPADRLRALEEALRRLGWKRPLTAMDLLRGG